MNLRNSPLRLLLLILTVLTAYRGWVAVHNDLPLFYEEAQYWTWAQHLDWGYYSKPPMVAWVIALTTLGSNGEIWVKLGALLLHPLTAIVVFVLGRRMFNDKVGFSAGLLFASLPIVGFNSLFITTDAPLFLFWGLSTLWLWQALRDRRWSSWLLTGAAVGLGMMSKYSMAIFLPSLLLVLTLPAFRDQRRNPRLYAAALLALLIFVPNLWWNAHMDFVSFKHTAAISHLNKRLFHPDSLLDFIAGQFGCMGPLAFGTLLLALCWRKVWRNTRLAYLAAMTLPFLGVIALQAFLATANVNWAAPTFFGGSLLVAAVWEQGGWRKVRAAAILLNLVLLSLFYHYHAVADLLQVQLTRNSDPYARVDGWPQLGAQVDRVLAANPGTHLAVTERTDFALLAYYARPHTDGMRIWNPHGDKLNQYELFNDIKPAVGQSFIFVKDRPLDSAIASRFQRWTALGQLNVPLYPDFTLTLYLYRGDQFKGYQP